MPKVSIDAQKELSDLNVAFSKAHRKEIEKANRLRSEWEDLQLESGDELQAEIDNLQVRIDELYREIEGLETQRDNLNSQKDAEDAKAIEETKYIESNFKTISDLLDKVYQYEVIEKYKAKFPKAKTANLSWKDAAKIRVI